MRGIIIEHSNVTDQRDHQEHGKFLIGKLASFELQGTEKRYSLCAGIHICTSRLSEKHRLVYSEGRTAIGTRVLFLLDVMWEHDNRKIPVLQEDCKITQKNTLDYINSKIAEIASQEEYDAQQFAQITAPIKRHLKEYNGKPCELTPEQYDIASRKTQGTILLAPAGGGKTFAACEWLAARAQENKSGNIVYVTLSPRLCAEVGKNLAPFMQDDDGDDDERIKTLSWVALDEKLTAAFPVCAIEKNEDKHDFSPADFDGFLRWAEESITPSREATKKEKKSAVDLIQLYSEFTQVIIQPTRNAKQPFLNVAEYADLGVDESSFKKEERAKIHALFQTYVNYLKANGYYEPHIRAHQLYSAVCTARSENTISENLLIDALVADEVQRLHPWQLHLLFSLLRNPKESNWFLTGDAHQSAYKQRRRMIDPIYDMLRRFDINLDDTTRILDSSYRNAYRIAHLANKLLYLENKYWGSRERETTYGLVGESVDLTGGFSVTTEEDQQQIDAIARDASSIILIPDYVNIADVRNKFPGVGVLRLSESEGLEWNRVLLYGFFSSEAHSLSEIAKLNMVADDGEMMVFSRKKGQETPSDTARNLILALYTAITRAKQDIIVMDNIIPEFLKTLIFSISDQQSELTVERSAENVISTPMEWIKVVKGYCAENIKNVHILAEDILCSDKLFSSTERQGQIKVIIQTLSSDAASLGKRLLLVSSIIEALLAMSESTQESWFNLIADCIKTGKTNFNYGFVTGIFNAIQSNKTPDEFRETIEKKPKEKKPSPPVEQVVAASSKPIDLAETESSEAAILTAKLEGDILNCVLTANFDAIKVMSEQLIKLTRGGSFYAYLGIIQSMKNKKDDCLIRHRCELVVLEIFRRNPLKSDTVITVFIEATYFSVAEYHFNRGEFDLSSSALSDGISLLAICPALLYFRLCMLGGKNKLTADRDAEAFKTTIGSVACHEKTKQVMQFCNTNICSLGYFSLYCFVNIYFLFQNGGDDLLRESMSILNKNEFILLAKGISDSFYLSEMLFSSPSEKEMFFQRIHADDMCSVRENPAEEKEIKKKEMEEIETALLVFYRRMEYQNLRYEKPDLKEFLQLVKEAEKIIAADARNLYAHLIIAKIYFSHYPIIYKEKIYWESRAYKQFDCALGIYQAEFPAVSLSVKSAMFDVCNVFILSAFRVGDFSTAIKFADVIIRFDPKNLLACIFRAKASKGLVRLGRAKAETVKKEQSRAKELLNSYDGIVTLSEYINHEKRFSQIDDGYYLSFLYVQRSFLYQSYMKNQKLSYEEKQVLKGQMQEDIKIVIRLSIMRSDPGEVGNFAALKMKIQTEFCEVFMTEDRDASEMLRFYDIQKKIIDEEESRLVAAGPAFFTAAAGGIQAAPAAASSSDSCKPAAL
ncbi:MAG: hypothetical protein NTZ67_06575 [Gammaproteobacteria bacterium]|nr:hypothetical protein [Gammaproteobacteria bacterium]